MKKTAFEKKYIDLRARENRVYPDNVVSSLPEFNEQGSLLEEWTIRKMVLKKLIRYFEKKQAQLSILELGCGNGWLSNRLAQSLKAEILSMDVNETELLQGAAIFKGYPNLSFMRADIFTADINHEAFDVILLASSIQYFPDIKLLMARLLELLTPSGEIHIVDSPIYNSFADARQAEKRSADYFTAQEAPSMIGSYFHHSYEELQGFKIRLLYNPDAMISKFKRKIMRLPQPVFPWVLIQRV